mmetsp:Transcript_17834/g.44224  ORF Transcript_17834/g.44224 Transcript_17834/m.44224 type:complete len:216 (-) Transcript_17834:1634-2281(-)
MVGRVESKNGSRPKPTKEGVRLTSSSSLPSPARALARPALLCSSKMRSAQIKLGWAEIVLTSSEGVNKLSISFAPPSSLRELSKSSTYANTASDVESCCFCSPSLNVLPLDITVRMLRTLSPSPSTSGPLFLLPLPPPLSYPPPVPCFSSVIFFSSDSTICNAVSSAKSRRGRRGRPWLIPIITCFDPLLPNPSLTSLPASLLHAIALSAYRRAR